MSIIADLVGLKKQLFKIISPCYRPELDLSRGKHFTSHESFPTNFFLCLSRRVVLNKNSIFMIFSYENKREKIIIRKPLKPKKPILWWINCFSQLHKQSLQKCSPTKRRALKKCLLMREQFLVSFLNFLTQDYTFSIVQCKDWLIRYKFSRVGGSDLTSSLSYFISYLCIDTGHRTSSLKTSWTLHS